MVAGINETIVEATDTIFLARYGITELGAVAIAAAVYELATFPALGLGDGLQIVVARRAAQRKHEEVGHAFRHALALLLPVSLFLAACIAFLSPALASLVIRSPEVREAVNGFLVIAAPAIVLHAVNFAFSALYIGLGRTRVLIGASIVLAAVNILLDWALIFGNLGLPRMGIRGAALSLVAAELCAMLYFVIHALHRGDLARYRLFRRPTWDAKFSKRMWDLSAPVSLDALVDAGRWFLFFLLVEQIGERALAGANIIYTCYAILAIPVEALADATCTLTSRVIGRNHGDSIGLVMRRAIRLALLVLAGVLAASALFPENVLGVFTSDESLARECVASLRVLVLGILLMIPAEIVMGAVVGTGATRVALLIELGVAVLALAYVYVVAISLELSPAWIWLVEALGSAAALVASWVWLKRGAWRRLEV